MKLTRKLSPTRALKAKVRKEVRAVKKQVSPTRAVKKQLTSSRP